MSNATLTFLTRMSDLLRHGRLEDLAQHFVYPLPFYANDGLLVFGSTGTLSEALDLYRAAVHEAGIVRITPRIVASGLPSRGYANVWVEWDHIDADGTCARTSQVRYVLFQGSHDLFPKIEMVDYTVTAFPEMQEQFPLLRSA